MELGGFKNSYHFVVITYIILNHDAWQAVLQADNFKILYSTMKSNLSDTNLNRPFETEVDRTESESGIHVRGSCN